MAFLEVMLDRTTKLVELTGMPQPTPAAIQKVEEKRRRRKEKRPSEIEREDLEEEEERKRAIEREKEEKEKGAEEEKDTKEEGGEKEKDGQRKRQTLRVNRRATNSSANKRLTGKNSKRPTVASDASSKPQDFSRLMTHRPRSNRTTKKPEVNRRKTTLPERWNMEVGGKRGTSARMSTRSTQSRRRESGGQRERRRRSRSSMNSREVRGKEDSDDDETDSQSDDMSGTHLSDFSDCDSQEESGGRRNNAALYTISNRRRRTKVNGDNPTSDNEEEEDGDSDCDSSNSDSESGSESKPTRRNTNRRYREADEVDGGGEVPFEFQWFDGTKFRSSTIDASQTDPAHPYRPSVRIYNRQGGRRGGRGDEERESMLERVRETERESRRGTSEVPGRLMLRATPSKPVKTAFDLLPGFLSSHLDSSFHDEMFTNGKEQQGRVTVNDSCSLDEPVGSFLPLPSSTNSGGGSSPLSPRSPHSRSPSSATGQGGRGREREKESTTPRANKKGKGKEREREKRVGGPTYSTNVPYWILSKTEQKNGGEKSKKTTTSRPSTSNVPHRQAEVALKRLGDTAALPSRPLPVRVRQDLTKMKRAGRGQLDIPLGGSKVVGIPRSPTSARSGEVTMSVSAGVSFL